eukprot:scaffold190_cov171-Amphora_coffeaeformis.AAC.34
MMRSSSGVHRRAHHVGMPREEEKKDDRDARLPIVRDEGDKDKRRNRRIGSLVVKLGRFLSTPSVLREHARVFFLPTLAVFCLIYCAFSQRGNIASSGMNGLNIIMPRIGSRAVELPRPFESTMEQFYSAEYEYVFDRLTDDSFMRNISYTGTEKRFIKPLTYKEDPALNKWTQALDDDIKRNPYRAPGFRGRHLERTHHCRQTALLKESYFSTCNDFHSLGFDSFALQDRGVYIGGGAFRDVFLLQAENGDPYVILKTATYNSKFQPQAWMPYRMDISVASAVSPHPLVVDIYGACALGMLSEPMQKGDVDVASIPEYRRHRCNQADIEGHREIVKMNDLNAATKLEWALQMAESVALLHNHPHGVIVHDDVQLFQWLIADDGHIKMNDFNRAEFMVYDEEHKEYCQYKNGVGPGDFRSPEEYRNEPLDERIDIYSLGNNFVSVLALGQTAVWADTLKRVIYPTLTPVGQTSPLPKQNL